MSKTLKPVFLWLSRIFFAFVIIVAILLIFSAFPIPGNYQIMVVKSGSMKPTIKVGSVVVVKPEKDYQIGDIITFGPFSKNHPPTTHRIYDIKISGGETFYITKGDANNAPDQKEISKKDIIGKVILIIPYVGYAIETVRKPVGFFFIIILPAIIVILQEIKKIIDELKPRPSRTSKNQ